MTPFQEAAMRAVAQATAQCRHWQRKNEAAETPSPPILCLPSPIPGHHICQCGGSAESLLTSISCVCRSRMASVTMPGVLLLLLALHLPCARGWILPPHIPHPAVAPRHRALPHQASDASRSEGASKPLPTAPIRAPRRLKTGDPPRGGRAAGGRRSSGGTRGPKGKEAVAARPQGKAAQLRELQRLHITGGSARGRRIVTPAVYMRPMMSRVREAVFSMLQMAGVLRSSAAHLDLFSGSGVVGLEALSRGIGEATFVDFSAVCAKTIRTNAEAIGVGESVRVLEARVDAILLDPARFGITKPFDLVTITPPYEEVVYAELMDQLAASPVLGEDSLVVVEYPEELGCFPPTLANGQLVGLRNRKYGRTVIALYVNRPSGKIDIPPFTEEFVSL